MKATMIFNIINVLAWCGLAVVFGKWWIALFSILTAISYERRG